MSLEFADIRTNWGIVKEGLETILTESQPDWKVEDVYAECVAGNAHLLMNTARTATGFTIIQSVKIPFSNRSKLLIWIAFDPLPDSSLAHGAEIETLAKNTGHVEIEFLTPHRALWSLGETHGYQLRYGIMNKKL